MEDQLMDTCQPEKPLSLSASRGGSTEYVRVKRPSVSLEDFFSASIRRRLQWLLILSLPILMALVSRNLAIVSLTFAAGAGLVAYEAVPGFGRLLAHAGRTGRDLNKPAPQPVIPESLGIAVGTIFLLTMFLFLPVPFMAWWWSNSSSLPPTSNAFPFELLGAYTAALLSITCMVLLGFADDVLNLKWRHKVLIPALSSLPLLMIYAVTTGRTVVVVPWPVRDWLGGVVRVDLGLAYYGYMSLLTIFCTHSINILAGVNGVEVGQTVVIALSVILHNGLSWWLGEESVSVNGMVEHLFSLTIMFPFLAVSLALLAHNWWPARVFVGDTFCYFAGMTFAVVGILGHFGKTLLLFFIPQIFNFIYSTPQLFNLVPCPRHRLPRFCPSSTDEKNLANSVLKPSTVTFTLTARNRLLVKLLTRLRLLYIYKLEEIDSTTATTTGLAPATDTKITEKTNIMVEEKITTNNFTLLNLLLVWTGPQREDQLARTMLGLQVICNLLALAARHFLAPLFFPH